MKISNVESFLKDMDNYNAEYKSNIEEGLAHENVCEDSYTDERLNWLFKHTRQSATGINTTAAEGCGAVKVIWYSASGQRLTTKPVQKGIYIKTSI